MLKPKDVDTHWYAGNLLMTTGSYEDAQKAFSNANNLKESTLSLYQRAWCCIALGEMDKSLEDLKRVAELCPEDLVVKFDKEMISILKISSE